MTSFRGCVRVPPLACSSSTSRSISSPRTRSILRFQSARSRAQCVQRSCWRRRHDAVFVAHLQAALTVEGVPEKIAGDERREAMKQTGTMWARNRSESMAQTRRVVSDPLTKTKFARVFQRPPRAAFDLGPHKTFDHDRQIVVSHCFSIGRNMSRTCRSITSELLSWDARRKRRKAEETLASDSGEPASTGGLQAQEQPLRQKPAPLPTDIGRWDFCWKRWEILVTTSGAIFDRVIGWGLGVGFTAIAHGNRRFVGQRRPKIVRMRKFMRSRRTTACRRRRDAGGELRVERFHASAKWRLLRRANLSSGRRRLQNPG